MSAIISICHATVNKFDNIVNKAKDSKNLCSTHEQLPTVFGHIVANTEVKKRFIDLQYIFLIVWCRKLLLILNQKFIKIF